MSVHARKYFLVLAVVAVLSLFRIMPELNQSRPISSSEEGGSTDVLPAIGLLADEPLRTIFVTVSMTAAEFDQISEASNRFMMKYPHITVVLGNTQSSESAYRQWKEDAQVGTASDVILLDSALVGELAVKGFLKPVDSLSSPGTLADHPARLLDALKWNGYLWGVPSDADPYLLIWSKELLAAAGHSQPPSLWSEFIRIADNLAAQEEAVKAVQFTPGDVDQLIAWLDVWASSEEAEAVYLTNHSNQLWKDRLRYVGALKELIPTERESGAQLLVAEMLQQKLLSAVIPWSTYNVLSEVERRRLIIDSSKHTPLWFNSRSYVVSSTTTAAEEAFTWIREMTSMHEQQQASQVSYKLPAKNGLYENSGLTAAASVNPLQWWLPLLNDEPVDEAPDPAWQARRQLWEERWRQYSAGAIDMETFITWIESN